MSEGQTTALTLPERAALALNSQEHERKLLELAQSSKSITDITNNAGREQCHGARMALKRVRVEIEKTGKTAREDATAFSKAVIAEEKRLIGLTEPEEKRLGKLQEQYDARIEAEKQAKAAAEARRKAAIQERIEDMRAKVVEAAGKSSAEITAIMSAVESITIDDTFAEFKQQAEGVKVSTLVRLRMAHESALKLEAEQKRLAEERAELARQRAAEDIRLAQERERLAEEQRRAREAAAAEAARQADVLRRQREAQQAEAKAERERLAEEQRVARARADAEAAENVRVRAEQEAAARAEGNRLAEEARRLEAQKAEQERLDREAREAREAEERRLAEQRAELERQQEALRAQQQTQALSEKQETEAPIAIEVTPAPEISADIIGADFAWSRPARPADEAILQVLEQAFSESRGTVLEWLRDMDIAALERNAA